MSFENDGALQKSLDPQALLEITLLQNLQRRNYVKMAASYVRRLRGDGFLTKIGIRRPQETCLYPNRRVDNSFDISLLDFIDVHLPDSTEEAQVRYARLACATVVVELKKHAQLSKDYCTADLIRHTALRVLRWGIDITEGNEEGVVDRDWLKDFRSDILDPQKALDNAKVLEYINKPPREISTGEPHP
ncbi:MAG: hypothetical protein A2905_01790 [Candidatus Levybacteria bacterium RIFCSPLOWO2_01_FULL_36_10]|nr:MAG: hypothetical protein A2905_01790 [Candidatus Levybacteria bacterium RIFCSPLOWO2_01_FULL_36_10]